jgi:hypothetical protein
MAHPKSRWEKGSPDTKERMAAVSQKAKEARETRRNAEPPSTDPRAPFAVQLNPVRPDIDEFTGAQKGFPQQSFGPNFLPGLAQSKGWPGDK